ncbi:nitroreductase family protein [Amycolatopsis pithecellobii]|uniref:Nitroreductase domain-containing protein n=1 Tax=Amycolatopsis pithecellobii TaxID=664692 RepID=A0A6N7YU76_9PSEU|nr:nitroreductase family protein [Amycolatopsis pithecellobii]MTD56605.1 hypothetical protein [Amycolatopsis pithecellobii]
MTPTPPPAQEALPGAAVDAVSHCMRTLRSVRRFLPADVDQATIDFVLEHTVQAGSAKNRQPWRFVVVRDRGTMATLGGWYRRGWQVMATRIRTSPDAGAAAAEHMRQMRQGLALTEHLASAPVAVVACFVPIPRNPANFFGGASIYPAIQNLLLAARAVGLGATLTTIQSLDMLEDSDHASLTAELRAILGIPADVVPAAVIPLGWPATPFGETRRQPVHAVAYAERWGNPWAGETNLALAGDCRA